MTFLYGAFNGFLVGYLAHVFIYNPVALQVMEQALWRP